MASKCKIRSQLDSQATWLHVEIGTIDLDTIRWSITLGEFLAENKLLAHLHVKNKGKTTLEDLQNVFFALENNATLESLTFTDLKQASYYWSRGSNESLLPPIQAGNYAKGLQKNGKLKCLSLENVALGGSIQSLADALRHNKSLLELSIDDAALTEQDLQALLVGLSSNTTLTRLSLPGVLSSSPSYRPLMAHIAKNRGEENNSINQVSTSSDGNDKSSVDSTDVPTAKLLAGIKLENYQLKMRLEEALESITSLRLDNKNLREENTTLKREYATLKYEAEQKKREDLSALDIPLNELHIKECVGAGGYGEVHRAYWRGQTIAIKRIKLATLMPSRIDNLIHESRTVMRLHHKHVVLSMGTITVPSSEEIMLVMEYMKHGSLEDLLFKQHVKLQRFQVIQIALDIAKGLNYLHCLTPKIIHRDLKCANILLYQNKSRAKISDFGTARFLNQNSVANSFQGTFGYVAPEVVEEEYDERADVYSFGMVLLVLATSVNNLPTTRDPVKLQIKIESMLDASNSFAKDHQFRTLVNECCQIIPADRPSMKRCIDVLKSLRQKCVNSKLSTNVYL